MPINISFDEQLKIYSQISDSTFHEIWSFGQTVYRENKMDTFRSIFINPKGKYFKFLEALAKEDEVLNDYYLQVLNTGDVLQFYQLDDLLKASNFGVEDIRVRFVIAINFLTLNDDFYRRDRISELK